MRAKLILCFSNSRILGEGLDSKISLSTWWLMLHAPVCSKAVVMLLFINRLLLILLFYGLKIGTCFVMQAFCKI